jgi:hypothetical protein
VGSVWLHKMGGREIGRQPAEIASEQSKKIINMDELKITAPERSALRVWRAEQISPLRGAG